MRVLNQRDFGSVAGGFEVIRDLRVPMRDGTHLATDVYLPAGCKRAPVLLHRTPYGRLDVGIEGYAHPVWYVKRGFVVVTQDTRGRWDSEGDFYPFKHEAEDGYDTIEWLAEQPWCNGAIGMYGYSYPGATQLLAASQAPPHLSAIAPGMTGSNYCDGWTYHHGALHLAFILAWTAELGIDTALRAGDEAAATEFTALRSAPSELFARSPTRNAFDGRLLKYVPYFVDWLRHQTYDSYWQQWSPRENYETISGVPSLHIAGWYDIFLEGTLENFTSLNRLSPGRHALVIGPWSHTPWSRYWDGFDFGPEGKNIVDELQADFFRKFLDNDTENSDEAPVRIFVMGANAWRTAQTWPPESEMLTWHLGSDGRANSDSGTGRLDVQSLSEDAAPDVCPVDPAVPVITQGGRSCCFPGLTPMGPADQRNQEARNDVLLYDSEMLKADLVVIGQPIATLFVGSEAARGDVIVRLADVHENGLSVNVSDGHVRWTWGEAESPTDPIQQLTIELSATAICFRKGHRVRLQVSGTSFPLYDRSPHGPVLSVDAKISDFRPAVFAVFHDERYPSRLGVPVCREADLGLPTFRTDDPARTRGANLEGAGPIG